MKRIVISLLVFIFLSSCSPKAPATPNVTVTFKVTVTSMPTETLSPTFTPTFTPTPAIDPDLRVAVGAEGRLWQKLSDTKVVFKDGDQVVKEIQFKFKPEVTGQIADLCKKAYRFMLNASNVSNNGMCQ